MNSFGSFLLRNLFLACVVITGFSSASAQVVGDLFGSGDDPFSVRREYNDLVAGQVTRAATPANQDAAKPAASAEDAKRVQERLKEINQLKFDRRPSAILKLWSAKEASKEDAKDEAEVDETPKQSESAAASDTAAPDSTASDSTASDSKESDSETSEVKEPELDESKLTPEEIAKAKEEIEKKKKAAEEKAKKEKELKEKQEKAKKEKAKFDKTKKILTESVTKSDWETFRMTLADRDQLSDKEALAAYDRMLTQLSAGVSMDFTQVVGLSNDMQQFMQQMMSNRRNNPATVYAEKHVINVSDLTGMIAAAPRELFEEKSKKEKEKTGESEKEGAGQDAGDNAETAVENNQQKNPDAKDQNKDEVEIANNAKSAAKPFPDATLSKFSRLIRMSLQAGSPIEDLVAAFEQGGDTLIIRKDIAKLLSGVNRDDMTSKFLPTSADAIKEKDIDALNLLAKHFLSVYAKDKVEGERIKAWDCTLAAIDIDDPKKLNAHKEALARAVTLAPALEDDLGTKWLQESFRNDPERAKELVAQLGTATAQRLSQTPQDGIRRGQNLELQLAAVEAFFDSGIEVDEKWKGILHLLANNWIVEAGVTRNHSNRSRYGSSMRRDRYGNLYYVEEEESSEDLGQQMALRRINPIKVKTIIDTVPSGDWFDSIPTSLQPRFSIMLCRLWLKVNEGEKAFPYIESIAKTDPKTARELAEEFLRVWTRNHNPNQASSRTNSYMFIYGYEQKADKIPLTRSKQERNLQELKGWVKRLNELPLDGELDEALLVSAFMTCHSVAEVYDVEDVESVFGAWDSVEAGTMARLIDQMRSNLSGVWRDPNVQRDAKTKRSKKDIQEEVVRGYQVANSVLSRAIEVHPENWQLLKSKACVMHDENDFLQETTPSSEFSVRRQAAFDMFAKAADAYIDVAKDLPEREQSNLAFDHWFFASLGATDLRAVSEENRPVQKEIDKLKATLDGFKGDVGKQHRERFANALFTRMSAVSPSCKFRYLEAGFQLVDADDPNVVEAKKVYDYYKDLVTELELIARIDGDARVGHQEPFGVYVDLRHTKELERESGGFGKYLQNQNSGYYSYNYGRPTENYRDKFENSVKSALEEHFDVLSVTFNHPETKSRDANNGWRLTPYAYLLLQARGPEVDKLPALKMDLDFLDTSGYVVLPIESSPLPIDASESVTGPNSSQLELVQVLDERQATDGKLIVEAKATGRGLVPALEELVDSGIEGFELVKNEDTGASVIEFDKEASEPTILSERSWTLEFEAADPAAPAPKTFSFPASVAELKTVSYQRYVDADLEEVEPTIDLVQDYGSNRRLITIASLCALAGLLLLVGLVVVTRNRTSTVVEDEPQVAVEETPFVVLSRLREYEQRDSINGDRKNQLNEDISAIESHYFAGTNGKTAPDLVAISKRWT